MTSPEATTIRASRPLVVDATVGTPRTPRHRTYLDRAHTTDTRIARDAETASDTTRPCCSRQATKSNVEAPMSRPTTADSRQRAVRPLDSDDDDDDGEVVSKSDKRSG
jgi:hypothetical protein